MALTCNIDQRGKVARLIYGIVMIIAAVLVIAFWAIGTGGWLPWSIVVVLLLFGAFSIFEARRGWCAVRAMGFKTRM
jgi:VIT1/CCC1 family predicted Fe2+/Mn2+ transporter